MNFKSIINDVCCDNRIKDGIFRLDNPNHVFILQEYLKNAGYSIEEIVNKTAKLFEGHNLPEQQAYNKDGILVTFPTKELKEIAVNSGNYNDINSKPFDDIVFKQKINVTENLNTKILTDKKSFFYYTINEANQLGFIKDGSLWYNKHGELIGEEFFDENRGSIIELNQINESLISKAVEFLKNTWNKVKSYFKSTVESLINNSMDNLKFGEETMITIPASIAKDESGLESDNNLKTTPSVSEGAKEAIRGNYNEALTVKYVIQKNETPVEVVFTEQVNEGVVFKVVQLDNKGKGYIPEIEDIVKHWDDKLKQAVGEKYEENRAVISLASNDMATYIINAVGKNKGNILQIFLDNKSFLKGAEFKADIRLKVKKSSGEEVLDSYSLKMYSTKSVNLSNSTKNSLIENLCGKEESEKFKRELKNDQVFQELDRKAKLANKNYQSAKKEKKSTSEMLKLKSMRTDARYPLNQYLATKVANKLKEFFDSSTENKEIFAKNILRNLGYENTETKFLMALVGPKQIKAGKAKIIDKHPELDLSDIDIVHVEDQVTIKIVNNKTNRTLINFSAKEGGIFAGFVDVLATT